MIMKTKTDILDELDYVLGAVRHIGKHGATEGLLKQMESRLETAQQWIKERAHLRRGPFADLVRHLDSKCPEASFVLRHGRQYDPEEGRCPMCDCLTGGDSEHRCWDEPVPESDRWIRDAEEKPRTLKIQWTAPDLSPDQVKQLEVECEFVTAKAKNASLRDIVFDMARSIGRTDTVREEAVRIGIAAAQEVYKRDPEAIKRFAAYQQEETGQLAADLFRVLSEHAVEVEPEEGACYSNFVPITVAKGDAVAEACAAFDKAKEAEKRLADFGKLADKLEKEMK